MSGVGDNSGITAAQLQSYIERVERLEEEKAGIAADIRDVYAEAKANGFDAKIMRQIVRLRKMDADDRREQEALLETYMQALGMLAGTPLGEAAMERARAPSRPPATATPVELVADIAALATVDPIGANAVVQTVRALAREPAPEPDLANIPPFLDRRGRE